MDTIKERVLKIAEYKGIPKEQFATEIGMTYGSFKGSAKNRPLNSNAIEKILTITPEINPEWLLTGTGEMLKSTEKTPIAVPVPVETAGIKPIPLVEHTAVAGFGNNTFAISEQDVKAYYTIPKFEHRKVDFMIEVYGNSMYPKYNSGDVVAATIVKEFIQWNKPHVIATRDQGILVKRILPGSSDAYITLKSDNKDYPEFEVPKSDITGIALIVGVIRLE